MILDCNGPEHPAYKIYRGIDQGKKWLSFLDKHWNFAPDMTAEGPGPRTMNPIKVIDLVEAEKKVCIQVRNKNSKTVLCL